MRIVRYLLLTFAFIFITSTPAGALETTPTIEPKPASPLLLTEFRTDNSMLSYIQLYNNSSEALYVADWELVASYDEASFSYRLPEGYLAPGKYLVVSTPGLVTGEGVEELVGGEEIKPGDQFSLVSKNNLYEPEPVPIATMTSGVRYHRYKSTAGNYTGTRTFSALKDQSQPVQADRLEVIRENFPLAPIEVVANPRSCAPNETDIACGDYVKFYNHTDEVVDFDGVRLRIGYAGQTASNSNAIALQGKLNPGEYAVFNTTQNGTKLNLTNSGAYIWLEYVYGVKIYDNTMIEYPDASAKKGQSWAIDSDGVWRWTLPNPVGENRFNIALDEEVMSCQEGYYRHPDTKRCRKIEVEPETMLCKSVYERNPETGRCRKIPEPDTLAPCQEGYYRHPETNRCRKIEVDTGLTPCKPGQYRNPETGRCKNIESTGSSLKPCEPGQYRNPATGRCKKIEVETASKLKPCAPGQERNPLTNRCRKIQKDISKADFKAEEVTTSADAVASWWALGGVGSLAVGYAGWEWRSEVARWLRRLRDVFAIKK